MNNNEIPLQRKETKENIILDEYKELYMQIIEFLKTKKGELKNDDLLSELNEKATQLSEKISLGMEELYPNYHELYSQGHQGVTKLEKARMSMEYFISCHNSISTLKIDVSSILNNMSEKYSKIFEE